MSTQVSFEFIQEKVPREFGGSLLKGKRKSKRILSSKLPIHVVLKSHNAVKEKSFCNHQFKIKHILAEISYESGVKVFKSAIVFNHIHLAIQIPSEAIYRHWIRRLTAEISQVVCEFSNTLSYEENRVKGFFTQRPYTRVLSGWGSEFHSLLEYIELNQMETAGIRPKKK